MQEYTFVLKHCSKVDNTPADALSRVVAILSSMRIGVAGFELVISDYATCQDFGEIHLSLTKDPPIQM